MLGSSRCTVFLQRRDAKLDLAGWRAHAARFFGATVDATNNDGARYELVVRAAALAIEGTVPCFLEATVEADWVAAEQAELLSRAGGMSLLARRCPTVARLGPSDARATLLLAAVVAGVELGPILSEDGRAIFGVKTARAELEGS